MILDDKLAAGDVIVLDGAIGSEIDRLGGKDGRRGGRHHAQFPAMHHARARDPLRTLGRPVIAYPEATGIDPVSRVARGVDPVDFAEHCRGWVEGGVQIIGGCCGTTIHHIRAMVDRLPDRPGNRPEVAAPS